MAAPSFIQEAETAWTTDADTTGFVTTSSFAVNTGDVLVAICGCEGFLSTLPTFNISDNTSSAITWSRPQEVAVDSYSYLTVWTGTADSNRAALTVTFTRSADPAVSMFYGGNVLTFRASDGVGASSKTNVSSGAPTLNITTTQANSAIVVFNADWNATDGASRTWRANAGTLTEKTYFRNGTHYAIYGGYHADAGAIGTYAVGLSAPTGQKYSIIALEVKGTAASNATVDAALATATAAGVVSVPTVSVPGALATATAESLASTPTGGAIVSAVVATATAESLVSTPSGGALVDGALATATAESLISTPTVSVPGEAATATAAALAADVTGTATVSAETATATAASAASVPGVTVLGEAAVAVAASLAADIIADTGDATVDAATATATAAALASTPEVSVPAALATATAAGAASAPEVSVPAALATVTAAAVAADVSGGATVAGEAATATAASLAATLSVSVPAAVATATAEAAAATITGGATVSASVATATAQALAATVDDGSTAVTTAKGATRRAARVDLTIAAKGINLLALAGPTLPAAARPTTLLDELAEALAATGPRTLLDLADARARVQNREDERLLLGI